MSTSVVFLLMLGVGISMATLPDDTMTYMSQDGENLSYKNEKSDEMLGKISKKHKPCCAPKQWEGGIGGFVGFKPHWYSKFRLDGEYVGFSYDATNTRTAMNVTLYSEGKLENFLVIELFKEKKMYVIDATGKCVSQNLTSDFQPICISANATYNGRFTTGLGDESSTADSWIWNAQGYQIIVSVTPKQCVPTSETLSSNEGGGKSPFEPMVAMLGFVNISSGIKKPSIFTPPKDCPTAEIELPSAIMQYMHNKIGGL